MVQLILPVLIASMTLASCSLTPPLPGCECQTADQQPCNRPAMGERARNKSRGEILRASDVRKAAGEECADMHDGLRACVDACNGESTEPR